MSEGVGKPIVRSGLSPEKLMPEVTWDPQAGDAYVSRNGAPIGEAPAPIEEPAEEISVEPEQELQETPTEEVEEETTEEEEESRYSPTQQAVIDKLTAQGMDVKAAFDWADSEESTLTQGTYDRLADLLGDEDPSVVELSVIALGSARKQPDWVASELESFTQEQEHALVDSVGGDHASQIVNLGFQIQSGELDVSDAYRVVARTPGLRNAFVKAAREGLLSVYL